MESPLFLIIGIVLAAIVIGGIILRRKRTKQAQELVETRGWRFAKSDVGVLDSYPQLFPLSEGTGVDLGRIRKPGITIGGGNHRDALDVIYLSAGNYPGHSFTYRYQTAERGSNNETSTKQHHWHIVGLELPAPFPNLTVRKRRRLDRFENKLTKPVEFPLPDFNTAFTIHSEHPPAAMDLITPDTAQWLMGQELTNEIVLEDDRIFIYRSGRQKVENIDPMLALLTGFLDRIPETAWQKAQGEYPRAKRVRVGPVDVGQIADVVRGLRKPRE